MQISVERVNDEPLNTTPDFISKLYKMIKEYPEIISFSEDGSEVHIHDYNKFISELLPKTFRHNKWRSFIRQMNMYNFRKLNRGIRTYIFINNIFRRGNQSQFHKIRRKINTKQQELQTQNNLQAELKVLVSFECQTLGIVCNSSLLRYNTKTHQPLPQTIASISVGQSRSSSAPALDLKPVTTSKTPISQPTLPSLSNSAENHHIKAQSPYTNSIVYFLDNILKYRRQTEQLCSQIKQNMEFIVKERKTTENKNILNSVKDSMQLIEEMSSKFKQKIQTYVDTKISTLQDNPTTGFSYRNHYSRTGYQDLNRVHGQNQFGNMGISMNNLDGVVNINQYINGNTMQNIPHLQSKLVPKTTNNRQKQAQRKPKPVSNLGSNPIIPQPIQLQNRCLFQTNNGNKLKQSSEFNWQAQAEKGSQARDGRETPLDNNNGALLNGLGVTSLCSFSSLNHIINPDKQ